ncbi:MAG: GTPase, partial [Dehalococcoidia bacterium]
MPANLPPQYFAAEKLFRAAKSTPEKIEALQTMLAIMPKHKGTDKLRAGLRSKMAKLTAEAERAHATSRKGSSYYIRKEGAGQAALVGLPNVGKSQLVAALTQATPEVADYPFTTHFAVVGMMPFENVQIQLIDLPPVTDADAQSWLPMFFRNADVLVLVVDQGNDCISQVEELLERLEQMRTGLVGTAGSDLPPTAKKALILANKSDLSAARDNLGELESRYGREFPVIGVSARDGSGLEDFKRKLFEMLDIIRVHTKTPGEKPDLTQPTTLKRGSTVA